MKISRLDVAKRVGWAVGAFGAGQIIRFLSSVVSTRLLAPDMFGIMVIVYSFWSGAQLLTDIGIGQNIIYHPEGNNPKFYNTAWSLQVVRGFLLWTAVSAAAAPLAHFYHLDILALIMPVAALTVIFSGFSSLAGALLQKSFQTVRLNRYEIVINIIITAINLGIIYFNRSIWALVWGLVVGSIVPMIGSYFLLPGISHRWMISRQYFWQIMGFSKWIFVSSIIYFMSTNYDRLYLGTAVPLALLGIYAIARTIADMLANVATRVSMLIVFPLISSLATAGRAELRHHLAPLRFQFLLIAAVGFAVLAATGDLAIRLIYDQRYEAAGWMMPVLIFGAWFSVVCSLNDSTLLGFGKPLYAAVANGLKFGWLLTALPLGFASFGLVGALFIIVAAELWRYVPVAVGQIRERFWFGWQDLATTGVVFGATAMFEWIRKALGLGTSFDHLPTEVFAIFPALWPT